LCLILMFIKEELKKNSMHIGTSFFFGSSFIN